MRRAYRGEAPGNFHVLTIKTKDTDPTRWQNAARFIYFRYNLKAILNIQVEIFNSDLMKRYRSDILPDDEFLLEELERAKRIVVAEVQATLPHAWTSIAFHLRTPVNNTSLSRPTAMIFCQEETISDFTHLVQTLVRKTISMSSSLGFEILPGVISPNILDEGQFIDVTFYNEEPQHGSSIGVADRLEAGTLGGHVRLNLPNKPPIPCFLTSYHVIRSANPQVQEEQDENGIRLGQQDDLTAYAAVNYPAHMDSKGTRESMDGDSPTAAELAHVDKLIRNSVKGRVIAASDRRTTPDNRRRLDWALIRNTSGALNKVRPIPRNEVHVVDRAGYHQNEDSSLQQLTRAGLGDWLAKKGRTSNWTTGHVNNMRRTWLWPEVGKITGEIEVFGLRGGFAQPGDARALVHNKAGELVGMLFAKDSPSNDHRDIGMVSQILDMQDDIKRMTGGFIILAP